MSETVRPSLLHMSGIHKAFDGVPVLRDVDLEVRSGEIHALVGENGAGKSTLMKILGGIHREYEGEIRIDGRPVALSGPRDAEHHGIAIIHQELALVPHLTVAENIFLGREPRNRLGWVDAGTMRRRAAEVFGGRLGASFDVGMPVVDLPIAAQQLVEISKALSRRVRILVMDEPTSALTDSDTVRLFAIIRQLRDEGVGIIYISHKMEEIYELADRITVLRDGQYIGTAPVAELPEDRLVHWMVGREISQFLPEPAASPGRERLEVRNLTVPARDGHGWAVQNANLTVRSGEIVGLAGLMGSGASELLGAVFGRYGRPAQGEVAVDGCPLIEYSPRAAIDAGVALLTNDRKSSGLVLSMSVLHNVSLATLNQHRRWGGLSDHAERAACAPYVSRMKLRAPSLDASVATLSGGNQQKVVFTRWLLTRPRVLLLDEPTRGIDVAAKADIYALLRELTAAGLGVLLITSELPELLALSDRILVMHRGRIMQELRHGEATQERIMHAAMGATV